MIAALSSGRFLSAPHPVGETAVTLGAAALLPLAAVSVDVDPMQRLGQISGLAAVQLRLALASGALLLVAYLVGRTRSELAGRLAPAAAAGLVSGAVAAGIVVALHGTPWPLYALNGDVGNLVSWAEGRTEAPDTYPPGMVWLIQAWAALRGTSHAFALQDLQLAGTALFGPVAYLSWRPLLPPVWALVVGTITALPLIDPYKPLTHLVLLPLVPLLAGLLLALRREDQGRSRAMAVGLALGVAAGVMFLLYFGWLVWAAPGAAVLLAIELILRRDRWRLWLPVLGSAAVGFLAVGGALLVRVLTAGEPPEDRYVYFDVLVEPAYLAMWRGDLPGSPGPWPPPGELGGVGLFSALLAVGAAVALSVAWQHSAVRAAAALAAGAWVWRMHLAAGLSATGNVQLYPRTTMIVLTCLLTMSVLAAMTLMMKRHGSVTAPGQLLPWLLGVLVLGAFASSSIANRYMPNPDGLGLLAYVAQTSRLPDGACPPYARPKQCHEPKVVSPPGSAPSPVVGPPTGPVG